LGKTGQKKMGFEKKREHRFNRGGREEKEKSGQQDGGQSSLTNALQ